jgi:O-antigen ligase
MLLACLWFVLRGLVKPFEGLLGLLAVTMINPGEIWPIIATMHIERLLVLVIFIGLIRQPARLIYPPLTKKIIIFWMAMVISIPLSFWPGGAVGFCLDFARIILYHFFIVNLTDTTKKFFILLFVFALLIGWVGGGAVWGYAHGSFDNMAIRNGFERATGLSESNGNPNTIGLTMVSGLPLVLLILGSEKKWQKVVGLIVALLAVSALILSGSRTSFVNFVLISLALLLNRKNIKFIPVLMVLGVVLWGIIPQQDKERYADIFAVASGKQEDESYIAHRQAREAGYAMIKDYPITGVGAGQFPIAAGTKYWPTQEKLWENPHNLYVQIPAELGIIGVVAWVSFMVTFVKTGTKLKRLFAQPEYASLPKPLKNFPRACMFALAALFIGGMFGHTLYRHTWYLLAGMIAALEIVAAKEFCEPAPAKEDEWAVRSPLDSPGSLAPSSS